jgi:hypothetical protein
MKRLFLILVLPILMLGLLLTLGQYLVFILANPDKAFAIARAIDITTNTGFNGKPDTTISARTARARNAGKTWGCVLCKFYALFQADHCDLALKDADPSEPIAR